MVGGAKCLWGGGWGWWVWLGVVGVVGGGGCGWGGGCGRWWWVWLVVVGVAGGGGCSWEWYMWLVFSISTHRLPACGCAREYFQYLHTIIACGHEGLNISGYFKTILISTLITSLWAWGISGFFMKILISTQITSFVGARVSIFEYFRVFKGNSNIYTDYQLCGRGRGVFQGIFNTYTHYQLCGRGA